MYRKGVKYLGFLSLFLVFKPSLFLRMLSVCLILILVYAILSDRNRLYHADLMTETANLLTVESNQNRWLITGFNLCSPIIEIDLFDDETEQESNSSCNAGFKPVNNLDDDPVFNIAANTSIQLSWSHLKGLVISVSNVQGSVGNITNSLGDRLILPTMLALSRSNSVDRQYPPLNLTFEGTGEFGSDVRLGSTAVLNQGVISAYEQTPITHERYLLQEFSLTTGDTIRFEKTNGDAALMKGFFRVGLNSDGISSGMHFVSYSSSGTHADTEESDRIKVFRFGTDGYFFSPTLWARIESAPDIILLISGLGLVLGVIEIFKMLRLKSKEGE